MSGSGADASAACGCIRKRPRRLRTETGLPPEIVTTEILARLPVKSLLRFRSVCKAWRTAISGDLSLVSAHLQHQPQPSSSSSSFLIFPTVMCGRHSRQFDDHRHHGSGAEEEEKNRRRVCNSMAFHRWEPGPPAGASVSLVHAAEDMAPEQSCRGVPHNDLAHCDGLVLVATGEGKVHLFNPSARQAVTLPWSPGGVAPPDLLRRGALHQAFGLGRDPLSGAYKAARYFIRQVLVVSTGTLEFTTGMEVLTLTVDRRWREVATQPTYPVIAGRTATSFKGSLLWTVDEACLPSDAAASTLAAAPGFLRLSLEDETFAVTPPPPCHPRLDYKGSTLSELRGELCVSRMVDHRVLELWMTDDAVRPRWERRYAVRYVDNVRVHLPRPVAASDDGIVFYDRGSKHYGGYTYSYTFRTRAFGEIKDMSTLRGYHHRRPGALIAIPIQFFVVPYRENLLQLNQYY